jgi:hypothetical protein
VVREAIAAAIAALEPPKRVPALLPVLLPISCAPGRLAMNELLINLQRMFRHFTLRHIPGPHFLLQSSPTVCSQLIADILLDADAK